jgi:hypothetical protein
LHIDYRINIKGKLRPKYYFTLPIGNYKTSAKNEHITGSLQTIISQSIVDSSLLFYLRPFYLNMDCCWPFNFFKTVVWKKPNEGTLMPSTKET